MFIVMISPFAKNPKEPALSAVKGMGQPHVGVTSKVGQPARFNNASQPSHYGPDRLGSGVNVDCAICLRLAIRLLIPWSKFLSYVVLRNAPPTGSRNVQRVK